MSVSKQSQWRPQPCSVASSPSSWLRLNLCFSGPCPQTGLTCTLPTVLPMNLLSTFHVFSEPLNSNRSETQRDQRVFFSLTPNAFSLPLEHVVAFSVPLLRRNHPSVPLCKKHPTACSTAAGRIVTKAPACITMHNP